ncbi:serine/arginine repetitive matrix protein 2-like [Harpegnathos saltator]|uniref:serine/arginine repetitive matrix protein 2-like n=1 Tax=Harpegnathos saltator TaxID=610380 RepID=UPI000DBEED98|nr:serine/arginine repetitive matrix protein 2-like [Harpegnathos saltator]
MSLKDLARQHDELSKRLEERLRRRKELEEEQCREMRKRIAQMQRALDECEEDIRRMESASASKNTTRTNTPEPRHQRTSTEAPASEASTIKIENGRSGSRGSRSPARTSEVVSPEAQQWNFSESESPNTREQQRTTSRRASSSLNNKHKSETRLFTRDDSDKENNAQSDKSQSRKPKHTRRTTSDRDTSSKNIGDINNNKSIKKMSHAKRYHDEAPQLHKNQRTSRSARLRKEKEDRRRELKRLANIRYRKRVREKLDILARRQSRTIPDDSDSNAGESQSVPIGESPTGGSVQRPLAAGGPRPKDERAAQRGTDEDSRPKETAGRPRIIDDRRVNVEVRPVGRRTSPARPGMVVGAGEGERRTLTKPTRPPERSGSSGTSRQSSRPNREERTRGRPDREERTRDCPDREERTRDRPNREERTRDYPDPETWTRDRPDLEERVTSRRNRVERNWRKDPREHEPREQPRSPMVIYLSTEDPEEESTRDRTDPEEQPETGDPLEDMETPRPGSE